MRKLKPVLILILLGGLGWIAYNLMTEEKSSLSSESLSEFAIKDTANITRVILSNSFGHSIDFVRKDNKWTLSGGECLQQHMINGFLETIKYIAVKSPVPKSAVENVNKKILGRYKKIEIFEKGKLTKTWFIGHSTADHYGTYMILKDEEKGTSPEPFIMYMPNVYGNLADQFSLRLKDYECSGIFTYNPHEIKSVEVTVPSDESLNFKIVSLDTNTFELYQNDNKIEHFDTARIRTYLVGFKKIHYDVKEPIIPEGAKDSTLNEQPNYIINVTDKSGESNKVTTYIKYPEFEKYDHDGKLIIKDLNNLFAVTNSGDFVLVQYFVFDKLFRDINYFKIIK